MPDAVDGLRPAIDSVGEFVTAAGIYGRSLREVVAALDGPPQPLAAVIRATAAPRRTVEELLAALGDDVRRHGDTLALDPGRAEEYRERFDLAQVGRTALLDPLSARMAEHTKLVDRIDELIRAAPAADQDLDHVSATAETVVRRALWLDSTFDLAGARLLCVGDHDLTSLAVAAVCPQTAVTVVDLDERILRFVAETARELGLEIDCLFADFRFGLPASAVGAADIVVTDPPYTPDGVGLFLARAVEGLRDKENGRIAMAYGFSPRLPALGLRVQHVVHGLHLTTEAILPNFNRYTGAQAVGSAADWYVCRPTAKTWRALEGWGKRTGANIYTHGAQSVEAGGVGLGDDVAEALLALAGESTTVLVGPDWSDSVTDGRGRIGLATVLSVGLPKAHRRREHFAVAVNLADDQGGRLLRVLLAVNAPRLVALVPNRHPDLADHRSQTALRSLVEAKYRLRFLRSTPDARYGLVEAVAVDATALDRAGRLANWVLGRAHGKVGNGWRDALVACGGSTVTKNEAREIVRRAAGGSVRLTVGLMELGRHDISALLRDIATSAAQQGSTARRTE